VEPAIEHAVGRLEPGGRLVDVRQLTGGVSADVFGLELVTSANNKRRVVFRRHRTDGFKQHGRSVIAKEYGVLQSLHRQGFAVPEPYLFDDADVAGPYMVIEWVEGSTDIAAEDLPTALIQMAQFLAELHSLDVGSPHLPELDQIEDPVTAIIAYLPNTDAGDLVRAALDADTLTLDVPRSVLLHGDYWPGNVMWHQRDLVAVIDWEDACLGDPLADLATARVELLCQYGGDAMEQFTAQYLAMMDGTIGPSRRGALSIWEVYVSAAALSTMASWGLEPIEEARRRRLTEGFFEHAARQLGP
jgi:aminoglycoside phosphotransferase (APT) family kinase protein